MADMFNGRIVMFQSLDNKKTEPLARKAAQENTLGATVPPESLP